MSTKHKAAPGGEAEDLAKVLESVSLASSPGSMEIALNTALKALFDGAAELSNGQVLPAHAPYSKEALDQSTALLAPPDTATDSFKSGWVAGLWGKMEDAASRSAETGQLSAKLRASPKIVPIMECMHRLCKEMRDAASQASDESARDFFNGLHAAKAKAEECRLDRLSARQKTLLLLAGLPALGGLSMTGVHRSLQKNKVLTEESDPSQTRRWLAAVGFPAAKPGRPKKAKEKK